MAKLASVVFAGKSGSNYSFDAYTLDTIFQNVGVVYIFTKRTIKEGTGDHERIYIGQTGELKNRIENHEKWDCFEFNGANCICVHMDAIEDSRLHIETDLIQNYDPPCNKQ